MQNFLICKRPCDYQCRDAIGVPEIDVNAVCDKQLNYVLVSFLDAAKKALLASSLRPLSLTFAPSPNKRATSAVFPCATLVNSSW
ncbi:MAG: hypothetical protein IPG42_02260 [Betaproteobacteria bacterium]|nr:hypothetical protein [Betaproteobacteria bacterium]